MWHDSLSLNYVDTDGHLYYKTESTVNKFEEQNRPWIANSMEDSLKRRSKRWMELFGNKTNNPKKK